MRITVTPSQISGSIDAPASKSSMQRACAAALVRKGETIIYNPGKSNDDKAALGVIQQLGAEIRIENEALIINSNGVDPVSGSINCGESGLGIRMFAPLVALSDKEITIHGEGSLLTRPMNFFDEVFPLLGVHIESNNGGLPLKIKGPLQPKDIVIDGSLSSQFLTGLLMAYAAVDAKNVTVKVNNLKSKPYIDLTLKVMKDFGLKVPTNNNYESFYFEEQSVFSNQPLAMSYTVEGDWSGVAFLLVAGAVAGDILIKNLDIHSTQADKKILEALKDCGCKILINEEGINIVKGDLKAFHFDATDCPDLFPPLAALAANCKGITIIEGVHRLAHKESNRALTIQQEFKKMNIKVVLEDNLMLVYGSKNIQGAQVHSHHDHRIAMMCAVAGLCASGETIIEDAEAINKSYPDFYQHLQLLGTAVLIHQSSTINH